MIAHIS